MSTPKWKAREVVIEATIKKKGFVQNRRWRYFEARDGRRFKYFNSSTMAFDKNTQFYVIKHSGEHNSVDYKYWIYPIDQQQVLYDPLFKRCMDYPRYFSGPRYVAIEIK